MDHLIGNLSFDLHHARKNSDGFQLQEEASKFCNDILLNALEEKFDELVGEDQWLICDRIVIDLGVIHDLHDEDELKTLIINAVEREILDLKSGIIKSGENAELIESRTERQFGKWLVFLRTGSIPLNTQAHSESTFHQEVLEALASEQHNLTELRHLLQTHPVARARLINQHSELFLVQLAEAFSGNSFQDINRVEAEVTSFLKSIQRLDTTEKLDQLYSANNRRKEYINQALEEVGHLIEQLKRAFWSAVWDQVLHDPRLPSAEETISHLLLDQIEITALQEIGIMIDLSEEFVERHNSIWNAIKNILKAEGAPIYPSERC